MISVLNTGFIICLSAAILFFIIAVVLFFIFDIKTIYLLRSGRAKAKSVKEMQEAIASSGHLQAVKKKKKKSTPAVYAEPAPISAPVQSAQQQSEYYDDSSKTEPLRPDMNEGSEETTILEQNQPGYDDGSAETTILQSGNGFGNETVIPDHGKETTEQLSTFEQETAVLSNSGNETQLLNQGSAPQTTSVIYFEIVKKIVCRDTDEVIC